LGQCHGIECFFEKKSPAYHWPITVFEKKEEKERKEEKKEFKFNLPLTPEAID